MRSLLIPIMLFTLPLAAGASPLLEADSEQVNDCILRAVENADPDLTVGDIRRQCEAVNPEDTVNADESLILDRIKRERVASGVPALLTAHRRNYLLPAAYSPNPNEEPFRDVSGDVLEGNQLDNTEVKFQVSLKASLARSVLLRGDEMFVGFTATAFWQAYNSDASAPFRETNYEPELFWTRPVFTENDIIDSALMVVGLSHQSNGRGLPLSRSWNRVYANFVVERGDFVFSLKPWWRIPDNGEDGPGYRADDNPDIERYLGHFEFTTIYRDNDHEFSMMIRNNLRSDNKGAVRLEYTFPLWGDIRGFAQYFNGYGDSLIDYDAHIERFGVGILLSDLL